MPRRSVPRAQGRLVPLRGRARESAQLEAALQRGAPLIVLVGPPGVGKSRLARSMVDTASDVFDASLVDSVEQLTPILDACMIRLTDHAIDEPTRLLIDGLDADSIGDGIVDLLDRHPELQVLVTSRSPLQISGETIVRVRPLRVPTQTGQVLHHVEQWPSLELFLDFAHLSDPGFEITSGNATDVLAVVRGTGGLPLGIELAARWLHMVPVDVLAARTRQAGASPSATSLPGVGLTATLERTVQHLTQAQFHVAAAMSQFFGPVSTEAVESVAGVDVELDDLEALARLGLIAPTGSGTGAWFEMPPITADHLRRHHPRPELRRRYQCWLLELIRQNAPALTTRSGAAASQRLEPFVSNLPMLTAVFDDVDEALEAALDLSIFWENLYRPHEGVWQLESLAERIGPDHELYDWLRVIGARARTYSGDHAAAEQILADVLAGTEDRALGALTAAETIHLDVMRMRTINPLRLAELEPMDVNTGHRDLDRRLREVAVRALNYQGACHSLQGNLRAALGHLYPAAELARAQGFALHQLSSLESIVDCCLDLGLLREAEVSLVELSELANDTGSRVEETIAALLEAALLSTRGRVAEAARVMEQAIDTAEAYAVPRTLHHSRTVGGFIFAEAGMNSQAVDMYQRALRGAASTDIEYLKTTALATLAATDPPVGPDLSTRALLWAIARTGEYPPMPVFAPWRARLESLPDVRTDLGLEDGLRIAAAALDARSNTRLSAKLTRRENEVLDLLRDGLTDPQIADRLCIGTRTVNTHVSSILRKLEVTNRRQAVAMVADTAQVRDA